MATAPHLLPQQARLLVDRLRRLLLPLPLLHALAALQQIHCAPLMTGHAALIPYKTRTSVAPGCRNENVTPVGVWLQAHRQNRCAIVVCGAARRLGKRLGDGCALSCGPERAERFRRRLSAAICTIRQACWRQADTLPCACCMPDGVLAALQVLSRQHAPGGPPSRAVAAFVTSAPASPSRLWSAALASLPLRPSSLPLTAPSPLLNPAASAPFSSSLISEASLWSSSRSEPR